jgi:hypothetical protein
MRLTSTGLGIGTSSPATKLHVFGSGASSRLENSGATTSTQFTVKNTVGTVTLGLDSSTGGGFGAANAAVLWYDAAQPLVFATSNTERMRLDSSGNLGLGVTPSAWSGNTAFQVGRASISFNTTYGTTNIGANQYEGAAGRKYIASQYALQYEQQANTGTHAWFTAPSGTAGDAITFTQALTLDASGNLGVGTTSPQAAIVAAGSNATVYKAMILRNGNGADGSSATIDFETSAGTQGSEAAMAGRIAGLRIGSGTSGALTFSTTNSGVLGERARITSGGVFQAGTIRAIGTAVGSFTASNWFIQQEDGGTTRSYGCGPDGGPNGRWEHYVATSTGAPVIAQRWNADANIAVNNIGVGFATPTTSGTGITFPTTQSASSNANTLDDYEEGAWTPTYTATTTNPTMAYIAEWGSYTKVGRLVTCYFHLRTSSSSTGGGVGDLRISGLPFTSASIEVNGGRQSGCIASAANFGALNFPNALLVNNNSTNCDLLLTSITAATTNVDASTLTLVNQGNSLFGAFSYIT